MSVHVCVGIFGEHRMDIYHGVSRIYLDFGITGDTVFYVLHFPS